MYAEQAPHSSQVQTFFLQRQGIRNHPHHLYPALQPKAAAASGQNNGGAYRDRTDDPLLAKQVLSQLS